MFPYKRVKVGMVSTAIASLFILASSPVAQASSYLRSNSGGELGFEFEKDGGQGPRLHDNLGPLNHGGSLGFEFEKDGGQGPRLHDNLGPLNHGDSLGFEFEKDGGQGPRFHDNLGPLNHGDSLGFEFEKDGGQGPRFHDKLDLPLGGGKYPSAILWSSKSV
ncbi:hypothetical protein RFF84_08695 [Streptococcus ruminantium]|nr:hypothetical protein [Streptococcus ruminantium]MDQ8780923.1 hypothetical protein [Streptococcus ruminantium]